MSTLLLTSLLMLLQKPADEKKPAPPTKVAAKPSASGRWNAEMAGHLLRRAGFSGTPEQIQFLAGLGRNKAVDYLIDYEKIPFSVDPPKVASTDLRYADMRQQARGMSEEDRKKMQQRFRIFQEMNLREMTNWWLARMVATSRPLEEKMTLFWHGHFT